MGAAMALRLLFRDGEPGSEVFSCAADRDQAAIVFEIAKGMVEATRPCPRSPRWTGGRSWARTGSTYKVMSAEAYSKHGLNPHGVIFDELHASPTGSCGTP